MHPDGSAHVKIKSATPMPPFLVSAEHMNSLVEKVDSIPSTAVTPTESITNISKYPSLATPAHVKVGDILYSGMNQDYKYKVTSLPDAEGWIGIEAISKSGEGPQGSTSSTKLIDGHMFFSEADAKKYHDNKEYLK
jgi:hypothetical protein